MKQIPLTKGKFALVDETDFEWLSQYNWCYSNGSAVRRMPKNNSLLLYMHREVLGLRKGTFCDHINGDRLDNRRENLRSATHAQNMFNKRKYKTNKSGIKGVCWDKNRNKFVAQIGVGGKHINLGRFTKVEDAIRAYNNAALIYHGEFATLNT